MDEFIQSAAKQLGLDESVTRNATSSVLGFLKNSLGADFGAVAENVPGAEQMAEEPSAESGGGGLFGSVAGAASSLLGGGGAGKGLELMGSLKDAGLSAEQGGSFMSRLLEYIKDKAGAGVLAQIAEKIPALKSFLG